jgi:diaminopimelate decarboxylase
MNPEAPIDLGLLPSGISVEGGVAALHGIPLHALAEAFGTPLFVYDAEDIVRRANLLQQGFAPGVVAYAGKAFLTTAVARLLSATPLHLDVASGGELEIAVGAGFDPRRIHLHGNAKSEAELEQALRHRIGRIVVDSESELGKLAHLAQRMGVRAPVMLRVTPGVSGDTHPSIDTGTRSSKFGVDIASGAAQELIQRMEELPSVEWFGIHAHIGSQVGSVEAFHESAATIIGFAAQLAALGWAPREINVGGGFAVRYRNEDVVPSLELFIPELRRTVDLLLAEHNLDPRTNVIIEPGRALIAPAALTLYRVQSTKTSGDGTRYVGIDGGMSDNPRPALYGARYEAFLPDRVLETRPNSVSIAGKHCEQGDVLIRDGALPNDVSPGDLLATPVTGAYGYSMANNYNAALRPAVVFVDTLGARLVRRRETVGDLLAFDTDEPYRDLLH